jgi:diguanylate cyclase (GGDEF)-like protein
MFAILFLELTILMVAFGLLVVLCLLALGLFSLPWPLAKPLAAGQRARWPGKPRFHAEHYGRADELATLYGALRDMAGSLAPAVVLQAMARHLTEALQVSGGWVAAVDRRNGSMTIVAEYASPSDGAPGLSLIDQKIALADFPAAFESTKRQEVLWCHAGSMAPGAVAQRFLRDHALHPVLIVPIMPPGQMPHVAVFWEKRPRGSWTPAQKRLVAALAEQAVTALNNAGLFQMERRAGATAAALLEIGQVTGSSLELRALLKDVARRTAQACGAHRCSIFLIEQRLEHGETREYLQPVMSQFADGRSDPLLWRHFRDTMAAPLASVPLFEDAVAGRMPLVLKNVSTTGRMPAHWLEPFGIQQLLVVPLLSRGRATGLLALDNPDQKQPFGVEQVVLALGIAGQVSNAISNARLYSEANQRAAELAVLARVGEALNQAQEMAEVLQLSLREALHLVNCQQGCIILLSPHSQRLYIDAQIGLTSEHLVRFNSRHFRPVEGTFAYAIGRGELLEISDTATDSRVLYDPSCPPPSQMTQIPLKTAQGTIGVIELNCLPADDRDRALLRALAALAAAAIEKARLIGELQQLATIDDVTGLYNRRHFFELAGREVGRAQRYDRSLAVILFDIDHFKQFNDTYGHATGDEVLRAVAARCRQALRDMDLLGRYGGEELVALLPESALLDAGKAAERLRLTVADSPIYTRCGPLNVTMSLGVATLTPDCRDLATLLDRADAAMYRAKQAGRNQIAF